MLLNLCKDTYKVVLKTVEYSKFLLKSVRMAHGQCFKVSHHCRCSLKSPFTGKKALLSRTDSWNPEHCFDVAWRAVRRGAVVLRNGSWGTWSMCFELETTAGDENQFYYSHVSQDQSHSVSGTVYTEINSMLYVFPFYRKSKLVKMGFSWLNTLI